MKTVGDTLEPFKVIGVKPGFTQHEENGVSAFEEVTESSFPGKWKVIYFYPKDFTFVCPTEIVGFNKLVDEFEERDAVLMGGSSDNEYVKLAWRRTQTDHAKLAHYQFADTNGSLIDQLGIRDRIEHDVKVALGMVEKEAKSPASMMRRGGISYLRNTNTNLCLVVTDDDQSLKSETSSTLNDT